MFYRDEPRADGATAVPVELGVETAELRRWITALSSGVSCRAHEPSSDNNAVPDGEEEALVSRLRALEDLKCAASAAQARAAMALDTARRRAEAAAGVPADQRGRGVGAEVALARRESPHTGSRLLGLARTLVSDMPRTLNALETGCLSEWRATLIVRETICLGRENRHAVDAELAADTGALEGVGSQGLRSRARKIAYRLEPGSAVARARKAVGERFVSCRPAPDTMAYLTALLPAAEAVSAYAALSHHADSQVASGESAGRGRGQLMADSLVERLTGVAGGVSRVEVHLVMTDRTLLQGDSEPAVLDGYGVIPAQSARDLLRRPEGAPASNGPRGSDVLLSNGEASLDEGPPSGHPMDDPGGATEDGMDTASRVWLRRLYTAPGTGQLTAMDLRARLFPPGLRRLVSARDATCRTPYCDAPIRHIDHVVPWRTADRTTFEGGQGLCEKCNYVKEIPGWSSRTVAGPRHAVERTTPTGHTYRSVAPPQPGTTTGTELDPRTAVDIGSVVDLILWPVAA